MYLYQSCGILVKKRGTIVRCTCSSTFNEKIKNEQATNWNFQRSGTSRRNIHILMEQKNNKIPKWRKATYFEKIYNRNGIKL